MEGWKLLGTIIAAGIGAFIANFASEWFKSWSRRNQIVEQNRDADLADMITTTTEIRKLAESYWVKAAGEMDGEEPLVRAKIVAAQHHLSALVGRLFTGIPKYDCDTALVELADATTGGDFGPEHDAAPGRLTQIYIAIQTFNRQVTTARRNLKRGFLS